MDTQGQRQAAGVTEPISHSCAVGHTMKYESVRHAGAQSIRRGET